MHRLFLQKEAFIKSKFLGSLRDDPDEVLDGYPDDNCKVAYKCVNCNAILIEGRPNPAPAVTGIQRGLGSYQALVSSVLRLGLMSCIERYSSRGSNMSEKKVVSRRLFIGFEIVCIVLAACLVGATSLYRWQIDDKDNMIRSLQSQVNDLNKTLNLRKPTVWVNNQTISQPQDSWFNWTFRADYAGYISIQVYNSTILNPSAEVVYGYHGINYDEQKEGATEVFPVMPTNIEIRAGNGQNMVPFDAKTGLPIVTTVNETVTITYYY